MSVMKKKTIVILGFSIFIVSILICGVISKLNSNYDLDDSFFRICGGDNEDMKCVYTFIEYNPFNHCHTFYYQVTHESIHGDYRERNLLQKGSKNTINGILDVANKHNASNWIELNQDTLVVRDIDDFDDYKKGDKISKDELMEIIDYIEDEKTS